MQSRLIREYAEFVALKPAWDSLCARVPASPLFLSHEWHDAAWQWCGQDAMLNIIACERNGELVGVLPLLVRTDRESAFHPRTLEFVAVPDTQHSDVLAAQSEREAVAEECAAALTRIRADWDVIRLRNLPAGAIATHELAAALGRRRMSPSIHESVQNPWIALTTDWAGYYAARSRRLKKAINLAANRLGRAGTLTLDWIAPGEGSPEDVERLLAILTQISSRSWKHRTGNSLDHAGPQAFIQRLAVHAHRRGWLSIFTLALDDKPVAMEFQIVDGRDVYALRADFDSALEDLSPGSHLSRLLLERLLGREFRRYYMGPGLNAYKYRWADNSDPVHTMTLYGRTCRGRALAWWERTLKPALRRTRDRLRTSSSEPDGEQDEGSTTDKQRSKQD